MINNAKDRKHWHDFWKNIFVFIMDENIMSGCPFWGWFKHRLEESRCNVDMTNSDDNRTIAHHSDLLKFHSGTFQRTWGGVPIIHSFGDCRQLPPLE